MEPQDQKPNKSQQKMAMINIAMELGFIIALPLVIFALVGKWLDQKLDTYPFLTLGGIVVAITSTTLWMVRRLKGYIK